MTIHRRPGVLPLGNGLCATHGDAAALFFEAVDEKMKTGLSKPEAIKAIVKNNPDLHAAYIRAHNVEVGPSSFRGQRA